MYLQVAAPSQLDYGDPGFAPAGVAVVTDSMGCKSFGGQIPRDEWVSLHVAFKLDYTGGWWRIWIIEDYQGESVVTTPDASYEIGHAGLGDWVNGGSHVQGSSTDTFYIDELIVTKDTQNTLDSGGRPFIHPDHYVSDF